MKPLMYDIRRAFTSRGVLAVMILIVVFSLAIIPLISSTLSPVTTPPADIVYSIINTPRGYNILFYVYNSFGQPLSGVQLNLTSFPQPRLFSGFATTNSSGFATMFIPYPTNSNDTNYQATLKSSLTPFGYLIVVLVPPSSSSASPIGQPYPPASLSTVTDSRNASRVDLFIFAVGRNFTKPDYSLYYKIGPPTPPAVDNMTFVSNITNYLNSIYLPIPSTTNPLDPVWVSLTSSNGSTLDSFESTAQAYMRTTASVNASSVASGFFSSILGLFVPLMAILGAYSVYGRDRVSGILESVLVRPVTRRGVLVSRFMAVVAAVTVATLITMLIVDLLIWYELKQTLGIVFMVESLGSLFVEIAAFVGIMFVLSQMTKSTGALIGTGIGLFMVLDFLWSLLLYLFILASGVSFGSLIALRLQVDLSFFNPSQFISLIHVLQTRTLSTIPVQPSQFGITPLAVILDGLLWVLIPVLVAVWLVTRRD